MVNPKPLCMLIIIIVLLAGVYEQQTGNVVSVAHLTRRTEPTHYKMLSGEVLIYFSLFLAAIASYIFRKE